MKHSDPPYHISVFLQRKPWTRQTVVPCRQIFVSDHSMWTFDCKNRRDYERRGFPTRHSVRRLYAWWSRGHWTRTPGNEDQGRGDQKKVDLYSNSTCKHIFNVLPGNDKGHGRTERKGCVCVWGGEGIHHKCIVPTSFISFQTLRVGVEPLYWSRANLLAHQSLTIGLKKSIQDDEPERKCFKMKFIFYQWNNHFIVRERILSFRCFHNSPKFQQVSKTKKMRLIKNRKIDLYSVTAFRY